MADEKSRKGFLTDHYFLAGVLPVLVPFFNLPSPASSKPTQIFQAAATASPAFHYIPSINITVTQNKKALAEDAQTGLRQFGYKGQIEGDWGRGTQGAYQSLINFAQSSNEYKALVDAHTKKKSGEPLTVDGKYGDYTHGVLKIMAADGRLGDIPTALRMVEAIERLKGSSSIAPTPAHSSSTLLEGKYYSAGDSIGVITKINNAERGEYKNIAHNGYTLDDMLGNPKFNALFENPKDKYIVINIGTNDIFNLNTDEQRTHYTARLKKLKSDIEEKGGVALFVDVRQNTGAYLGGAKKDDNDKVIGICVAPGSPWYQGGDAARQEAFAKRMNDNVVKLNDAVEAALGKNNFLRTDGLVKIGADHLHPVMGPEGSDKISNMVTDRLRDLGAPLALQVSARPVAGFKPN